MFKHKHRVGDEIPDFNGFLVYVKQTNRQLHDRYMKEVRKAMIADICVFAFFIAALVFILLILVEMNITGYISDVFIVELVLMFVFVACMVISSVIGRQGHSEAIKVESEIVVFYHKTGFQG